MVVIGNGAVGLWALGAHRFPTLRGRALWWSTAAAEVALFVEVGLGVALMQSRDVETEQLHSFYGFVAIVAIGILYSYRHQLRRRQHLLYGLGSLFVMGLALRAMTLPA